MSLPRSIEPEWLDTLPADDPGAVGSRRDLRVLNGVMLQARAMARLLSRHGAKRTPRTILELGAGDGTFMLRIARRLARHWPGVTLVLLDQQSLVTRETREAFHAEGWSVETATADIFDFLDNSGLTGVDAVTANLFLHHFPEVQLGRMFARVARLAPLFVACEPRRNALALLASGLVWALGCNHVTRHDAPASVRAGFKARELSAFWPKQDHWRLREHAAGPLTHCFAARRGE